MRIRRGSGPRRLLGRSRNVRAVESRIDELARAVQENGRLELRLEDHVRELERDVMTVVEARLAQAAEPGEERRWPSA